MTRAKRVPKKQAFNNRDLRGKGADTVAEFPSPFLDIEKRNLELMALFNLAITLKPRKEAKP